MLKGLETKEIDVLMKEYYDLFLKHSHGTKDAMEWVLTFKDYLILRTGIGLEKEMKLYKVNQRINDIEEDFND